MVLTGLKAPVRLRFMFERFTGRARHVVVLSQEEARLLNHNYIGTEHILLGLLGEPESVGGQVLAGFGFTIEGAREEVAAMLEHCRSDPDFIWLADIVVALTTAGVRIGELAALRWSDLDLDANVLKLTDERYSQRRKHLGNARLIKGKRGRTIPMNLALRNVLVGMQRSTDGLVFHGPRGGKLKPDVVRTALLRDVIRPLSGRFPTVPGEIGFEHGRVHSFRHYFVSEAFRLGVPEPRIMEWVGHRDSRIVARYRHLRDDDGQHAMQELEFLCTK